MLNRCWIVDGFERIFWGVRKLRLQLLSQENRRRIMTEWRKQKASRVQDRLVRWCPLQWLRAWLPPSPRWKPIQDLLRCMADEPWLTLEQCQVQSGSVGWLISVLSQHENRHCPPQTYLSHQTKGYFWAAHLTYHWHLEVSLKSGSPQIIWCQGWA